LLIAAALLVFPKIMHHDIKTPFEKAINLSTSTRSICVAYDHVTPFSCEKTALDLAFNLRFLRYTAVESVMESSERTVSTNRKAFAEFDVLEKYEAGISLTGSEVKSVREGKVNLKDSYALIKDGEALLFHCHISPYHFAHQFNHEPTRTRKLLLHKREIMRLMGKIKERGLTVVPLRVYFKGKHIKVEIALAKAKKIWGKREEKRKKTVDREVRSALKYRK
jgi:SsrA-binding protein